MSILPLCEKYRPTKYSELIQQQAIITLRKWILSKTIGSVLLSGPPGVGKTSAATLLAKESGYSIIELNASDTRSASLIRSALKESITNPRNLIIVDEIDGMSSSDKGGIQELIKLISVSKCPIICICNDRQSNQARTLAKYCSLDIKFEQISSTDISKKLTSIATTEHITMSMSDIRDIAAVASGDMRTAINHLHIKMHPSKDKWLSFDAFTSVRKIFEDKRISFDDAIELMYVDSELGPLVAHQHILDRETSLSTVVKAADAFSFMDIVDQRIYKQQSWELLPYKITQITGTIRASHASITWTQFPSILSRMSSARKRQRQLEQIGSSLHVNTTDMRLSWTPLQQLLSASLTSGDIDEAVETTASMGLTRDDMLDVIMEISLIPDDIPQITTKNKSAFTRQYNKKYGESVKTKEISIDDEDD